MNSKGFWVGTYIQQLPRVSIRTLSEGWRRAGKAESQSVRQWVMVNDIANLPPILFNVLLFLLQRGAHAACLSFHLWKPYVFLTFCCFHVFHTLHSSHLKSDFFFPWAKKKTKRNWTGSFFLPVTWDLCMCEWPDSWSVPMTEFKMLEFYAF